MRCGDRKLHVCENLLLADQILVILAPSGHVSMSLMLRGHLDVQKMPQMAFSTNQKLTSAGSLSTEAFSQASNAINAVPNLPVLLCLEELRQSMMDKNMTTATREKFSCQAAPDVLAALRQIAESQGRQFQAVLDDALRDYIDRHQKERPRHHVMASFASSLDEFDTLYRELAK